MDLQTAIETLGGNYEDLLSRLMNETLVKKFLTKFLEEKSFFELKNALDSNDMEEAFKASHTLKGICQSLSLGKLGESSSDCCEVLRTGNLDEGKSIFNNVQADYDEVIRVLKEALS